MSGNSRWAERLLLAPAGAEAAHGGGQWEILGPSAARLGEVVPADVNDPWYPPAPKVVEALELSVANVQHTPETHMNRLRTEVAGRLGVDSQSLLLAAGSSPILHHLIGSACGPQRPLLVPAPTYSEYERVGRLADAPLYRWRLLETDDFSIDPSELAAAAQESGAALVALANPNNPSGQVLSTKAMGQLVRALPADCLLLVDEAYVDQVPEVSFFAQVDSHPTVAVVRSLSKGAALAGVRLGYGLLGEGWAAALPWNTPPWPVSLLAQAAALPALDSNSYVEERVRETQALRKDLFQELAFLPGLEPLHSLTHFFLLRLGEPWPAAPALVARLRKRNVLVRDCTPFGTPLSDRYVRVTTRSREENRRIHRAFHAVSKEVT